jgi:multiple sugar transport system ATP-binding protein
MVAGQGTAIAPLQLWHPQTLARHTGQSLTVGVRAEDLQLGDAPPGHGAVTGVVEAIEPLGAETLLLIAADGVKTGTDITARLGRDVAAQVGERVTLHFDPAAVHLFDPETTRAIAKDL